nr:DoxX-like family protein [Roseateles oligotrophus]
MQQGLRLLRWSLVSVWLLTSVFSVLELNGQSSALLVQAGVRDAQLRTVLVLGGAGVDLLLGLAMLLFPGRRSYAAAFAGMVLMTVLAGVLLPDLWLHPLGPLMKNLPIAAALWLLWRQGA